MRVKATKTTRYFTKGKVYIAKHIFKQWPWMLMAWDKYGIGRYIHLGDYGEFIKLK